MSGVRRRLHVVQLLGGNGAGTGVHVRSLSAGLVARGLRVSVCAPEGAETRYGYTTAGAGFCPLPGVSQTDAVRRVRGVSEDADVVHAHGLRAGMIAALALRGRPVPLVVTWHTRPSAPGRGTVRRLTERWVARAASVVLGATSDLVDRARHRGARDARLAPVALPAPRPLAAQDDHDRNRGDVPAGLRAALGAEGRPLIVTAGRLTRRQGHDVLLSAAAAWRGTRPRPLLVIAGEGPERAALRGRIDAEELPVRLLGCTDDLGGLLAAADVAVLAARWEGRSLLAQEALRAGVPLVATAVGGVPELVGDAAVLVPPADAAAVAAAVTGLLADPGRRAELAVAGRARAGTWPTEDGTVAQVLSVYDELTEPR